jgi:hypothetical protein
LLFLFLNIPLALSTNPPNWPPSFYLNLILT